MNKAKRDSLRSALAMLNNAVGIVESVCDKEQDCLDNYPENLQSSERFEKTESAVDSMNDALDNLSAAQECILAAIL